MSNVLLPKRIGSVVFLTVLLLGQMPAAWSADARSTVAQIIATISNTASGEAIDSKLRDEVDYATITQMAFTPSQWSSFTALQRDQLKREYRELISRRYYVRWHKLFARSKISYGDIARANGDTYVRTSIKHGKETDIVIWQLRASDGQLVLVDLKVNDKGLIARLAERSQSELTKQGAKRFLAWVQQEASQTRETAARTEQGSQTF